MSQSDTELQELRIKNQLSNVFLTISDEQLYARTLEIILEVFASQFGTFVAGIPAPPGIGKLELVDESVMNGFVREGY